MLRRSIRSILLASFITVTVSCSDNLLEAPRRSTQINIAPAETLTAADSVAKAIAMAMADSSVRSTLRDHLRDSPFEQKRIELVSYIAGRMEA